MHWYWKIAREVLIYAAIACHTKHLYVDQWSKENYFWGCIYVPIETALIWPIAAPIQTYQYVQDLVD